MSSDSDLPVFERGQSSDLVRRVLIIDDDRDVGTMMARLLKPTPVVFAQSASGALGRIHAGGRFGAIICDIHMPGIDGMKFYEAVAAEAPALARRNPLHDRRGDHAGAGEFSPSHGVPLHPEAVSGRGPAGRRRRNVFASGVNRGCLPPLLWQGGPRAARGGCCRGDRGIAQAPRKPPWEGPLLFKGPSGGRGKPEPYGWRPPARDRSRPVTP